GHRAAMSYPRLVGYAHHPQAKSEEFSNEIILLVIEGSAAEMTDRSGVINRMIVDLVNESTLARFPNAIRHHVHRAIERNFGPLLRTRRAIFHFRFPTRMRKQLI